MQAPVEMAVNGPAQTVDEPEGVLAQARGDKKHGSFAAGGFRDQAGPDIGLHEYQRAGLQHVPHSARRTGKIGGQDICPDQLRPIGQPGDPIQSAHRGQSHGHLGAAIAAAVHDWLRLEQFAGTGHVKPDQRPGRIAPGCGLPQSLADSDPGPKRCPQLGMKNRGQTCQNQGRGQSQPAVCDI